MYICKNCFDFNDAAMNGEFDIKIVMKYIVYLFNECLKIKYVLKKMVYNIELIGCTLW